MSNPKNTRSVRYRPIALEPGKAIKAVLDWLFPPRCIICKDLLRLNIHKEIEYGVCELCEDLLNVVQPPFCSMCGIHSETDVCPNCKRGRIIPNKAVFEYDPLMREVIHRFKYSSRPLYANGLARMMMNHLDSRFFDSIDALVPAPMYHKKLKKRGYNQAEELARALSKSCALPVITDWLVRVRDTTPQSGLSIDARENNLVGAFALRGERDINSVLIIDDIYTTGATINACGKTLAAGGARAVRSLTLAIALKHIDDNAVLMK